MATLYFVIYPAALGNPSAAQIKAGHDATDSPATASGSETAATESGEQIFVDAATGLTLDTSYKIAFVWSDGENDSAVVVSDAWSTEGLPPQFARPTIDVTVGNWTPSSGTDLYAMLDEETPSDADYIETETADDTCEIKFGALNDPEVSTGHKVRYRVMGNGVSGVTVKLVCGTTVIATWTHDPAPATETTYEQTLTGTEADAITNYADLRLRVTEV